ncbi:MAG: hydrogenase small subunit [Thermodesulfobacteriota bacterium]|nr:hydrogenase small subunit [Thermodesulfobacteriota bacterium]
MVKINRRDFMKQSAALAAMMGLGSFAIPDIAKAMQTLSAANPPVLWIQGQSCSGCSISLLNSENPGPVQFLTRYISLVSHQTLSTATGETFLETMDKSISHGGYYLVVEGSMPAGMPGACLMNHEPVTDIVAKAARNAKAVITLGTCASFGGIPAAEGNPTGAVSVPDFLDSKHIKTDLIRLPGCPAHPDWLVGTLVHILGFGMPELDRKNRPKMFYGKTIHDQCPRFADYERENFAEKIGDPGCLFKLGCCGPITYADCNIRKWNSGTNTCINAGAPCTGCASENYMAKKDFPLFRKNEKHWQ